MNIENNSIQKLNNLDFKGNKISKEDKMSLDDNIREFYKNVRQNMPLDEVFDGIEETIAQDEDGSAILSVTNYKKADNTIRNNLKLEYQLNDCDFMVSANLAHGTKQNILDYLGNDKNADEIRFFIKHLKKKAKEKS